MTTLTTPTTLLTPRATDAFVNFSRFEVKATLGNMLLALRHEYVRGPKTQFRRPVKVQPPVIAEQCGVPPKGNYRYFGMLLDSSGNPSGNHFMEALDEEGKGQFTHDRQAAFTARSEAFRRAAHIAQYFCVGHGDEKDYPSVIGLEIAQALEREAERKI